jgi:ABC-2 type transport system permease protein
MTAIALSLPETGRRHRLSFGGMVDSEWIKLRTLRSTWWCLGLWLLMSAALSALVAVTLAGDPDYWTEGSNPAGLEYAWLGLPLAYVTMAAAVVVPLMAVIAMTSEYTGGVIRSTLVVAPRRIGLLAAKAVVVSLLVAVATLVVVGASGGVSGAIFGSAGVPVAFDGTALRMAAGAMVFCVAMALLALGLGAALRSTAGGITASLGVLLGLPMAVNMMEGMASWVKDIQDVLPLRVGQNLFATSTADLPFSLGASVAILAAWVGVALLAGGLVLRNRDA